MSEPRTVVWFSCGAASAVAAKLTVTANPDALVVYCDTLAEEHPDNHRFLQDVEKWIGKPIQIIRSTKFGNVEDVWDARKYMAGIKGAPCTVEMKKIPRFEFQLPDDIHVFGLTVDEDKRISRFIENNPELSFTWVLRDAAITKDDCYAIIRDAGIELPAMYALGFNNNNCIGCVKSTSSKYWCRVRRYFPEVFERRAVQSRRIGARLVRYKGVRIFLDELPCEADLTHEPAEEDIECGVICLTEQGQEADPVLVQIK